MNFALLFPSSTVQEMLKRADCIGQENTRVMLPRANSRTIFSSGQSITFISIRHNTATVHSVN